MSAHRHRSAASIAPHAGEARVARRSSLLWSSAPGAARTIDVLGLPMENVRLADAASDLIEAGREGRQIRVVFANAHVMNCAAADPAYRQTVASADWRYADGSGLAIAARLAGNYLADNVNGTDLLPLLAAQAVRGNATMFLLGGAPGAAAGSASTLAARGFPQAIAGTHHGFFEKGSVDEDRVIAQINASGASVLLVGMGVPLQDQWIERNAHRLQVPVLVGVGGLFDFFSGKVTRAPEMLRTLGLEWTWRLALEPRRMWRRYLLGNGVFLARAAIAGLKARFSATQMQPTVVSATRA